MRDFATDIFRGHCPRTPMLGRGYSAPRQTSLPLTLCASRVSMEAFGPSIVRLCAVVIFPYEKP